MIEPDRRREFVDEHAIGSVETLPCHWVHGGGDEGSNYCFECCEKEVASIINGGASEDDVRVDGGWTTEHDSIPYCETCDAKLDGNLTDYGAEEQIKYLTNFDGLAVGDMPIAWAGGHLPRPPCRTGDS